MVVGDADNLEQVRYRARKAMADARLNAYELTALSKGIATMPASFGSQANGFASGANPTALMMCIS
jgi:prophage tail gpP-like protein